MRYQIKQAWHPARGVAHVLAVILWVSGCTEPAGEQRAFAVEELRLGPLVDSVLATGRVHAVKSVDVSSQLSGRVDEVYVDFNDVVEEGAPLARLDPQRFQSRVEELEAALAIAEAELLSVEAALKGAEARVEEDRRDYERKADLVKRGGISASGVSESKATMLQSQSTLSTLGASKAIKVATIAAARASLRQAQIDLERTTIRAPISGVLIERSIEPGQTVAVSLSAPELFTIVNDLGEIEIHARVDEADIGKVSAGQEALFSVDAHPEQRFDGVVSEICKSPEVSQGVVSYHVVVEAANPDEHMLPGMTALVEIITARKKQVLRVPNAALRFEMPNDSKSVDSESRNGANPTKPGVWIVQPLGSYRRVSLQLGYTDGEYSEVLSGDVGAGSRVVVGYRR